MSEEVGPVALTRPSLFLPLEAARTEPISQQVAAEADAEVRRLLGRAEEQAAAILAERRDDLDRLARLLLERETLERPELEAALAAAARRRPEPVAVGA